MRAVLDTKHSCERLLGDTSLPSRVLVLWREGKFSLLTSEEQLEELRRVTRDPRLSARLSPGLVGRLINEIRDVALDVEALPLVERSPDPYDNYLLAIAEAGQADYLVTGDKSGLLYLDRHKGTQIISAIGFAALFV